MRYILAILLIVFSTHAWAESESSGLVLTKAPVDPSDIESIKRGAKFFAGNCMSCHTLVYLRYDKVAQEAGITYDKMPINVKSWPYGVTPPDLSLEADIRGVDWIYTYLHSFYQDSSRPTGVNNLLVPGTAMPGIISAYQGQQVLLKQKQEGLVSHDVEWFDMLELVKQGTMTPDEFDSMITDVVNFLNYAAEPYQNEQRHLGVWVLGFLALFFVLAYMLKKEYWKDVKKHQNQD